MLHTYSTLNITWHNIHLKKHIRCRKKTYMRKLRKCKHSNEEASKVASVRTCTHTHTHGGNKEITKHKPETKATNQTFRLNEKENMHSRVISCLRMCWKTAFSMGQGKKPLVPQATDMFLNHTPGDVATLSTEESSNHPSQKPRLRFEKCTIMYRKHRFNLIYITVIHHQL